MNKTKSGVLSVSIDLATEISKNFLMGFRSFRERRLKNPRTATVYNGTEEFLKRYAFSGLDLLLEYIDGDIKGKTICEIGAGDYLTSGMSMLAAGARKYTVIDRFPGTYDSEAAKQWYLEIEKHWDAFYPGIPWSEDLDASKFPESYGEKIEIITEPIETAKPAEPFDIICSFQVGEHVSDIEAFAQIHQRLLKAGGVGLHRVDFGPHGCWSLYDDPSTFLRFSSPVWEMTGSNRGAPNRKRHHEFMEAFDRAGLEVEILLLERYDEQVIRFEKMNKKFRAMPKESLLIGTAIYRLSKR